MNVQIELSESETERIIRAAAFAVAEEMKNSPELKSCYVKLSADAFEKYLKGTKAG